MRTELVAQLGHELRALRLAQRSEQSGCEGFEPTGDIARERCGPVEQRNRRDLKSALFELGSILIGSREIPRQLGRLPPSRESTGKRSGNMRDGARAALIPD